MTIHYLPTEAAMHTNEWPARRCTASCSGDCGKGDHACKTPEACWLPEDEAVSPLIGILVGSVLGALMICGAVWLWRSLL